MRLLALAILFCFSRVTLGAVTPLDITLSDDSVTKIECANVQEKATIKVFDYVPGTPDKTYFYNLYVPRGYNQDTTRHYPILFITAPAGEARLGAFKQYVKQHRWIVVMLTKSSNKSYHWYYNFLAANDDVEKRVRFLKGHKFATGVSGAARTSSAYPSLRDGFAGVFMQAAGIAFRTTLTIEKNLEDVVIYQSLGNKDYNLHESDETYRDYPVKVKREVEIFKGGHSGAPRPTAERGMAWLTQQVFVDGVGVKQDLAEAARWYCEGKLNELKMANSDAQKYEILSCLQKVNPRQRNAKLSMEVGEALKQMAELRGKPSVVKHIAAKTAYEQAVKLKYGFFKLMCRKEAVYKKRKMDNSEFLALGQYVAKCQSIANRWGDTQYGKYCKVRVVSSKDEFKDAPLNSFKAEKTTAEKRKNWPHVARMANLIMAWSEAGSNIHSEASTSYKKATEYGDKIFAKFSTKTPVKKIISFCETWAGCDCAIKAMAIAETKGREELNKAKEKSGSSRVRVFKSLIKEYKEVPTVYGEILSALDQEATAELKTIEKTTSSSYLMRKLQKFIKDWAPAPSTEKAKTLIEQILNKELETILAIKSDSTKKYKLKSFIKKHNGTTIGAKAQGALDEIAENEAKVAWEKLLKTSGGNVSTSKKKRFISKHKGTRIAQEVAATL